MANLLSYIDWRGDLGMENAPFNEVDNLILAELSFIDFSDIICRRMTAHPDVTLREAGEEYFAKYAERSEEMGLIVPGKEITGLLQRAMRSRRFGGMKLLSYTNVIDEVREMQFSALAAEAEPGRIYIAFRGTDDTLIAWKEDFNLGFLESVPAQREAKNYVNRMAELYPKHRFILGGHSKGGNLAVYAGVKAESAVRARIDAVYNNDGPGFGTALIETPEHREMESRIHTIVPSSDVVGMLLRHEENYRVVRSDEYALRQHDGFSWQVLGDRFVYADELSPKGRMAESVMRSFAAGLSPEERKRFSELLFELLGASKAKTLSELEKDGLRAILAVLRVHKEMSEEDRRLLSDCAGLLIRSGKEGLKELWEDEEYSLLRETFPKLGEAADKLEGKLQKLTHTKKKKED